MISVLATTYISGMLLVGMYVILASVFYMLIITTSYSLVYLISNTLVSLRVISSKPKTIPPFFIILITSSIAALVLL